MKKLLFIPFIMFAVLQWTCSDFPLGLGSDDPENWVAMTALIKEYGQIVLVNFNNPSKYKVLTNNKHRNFAPRFSHDKKWLVYSSKFNGTDHNNALNLLNVFSGASTTLKEEGSLEPNIFGGLVVWGAGDLNIYYSLTVFNGSQDVLAYNFINKSVKRLTATFDYNEYPVGIKGQDTLIVFSDDTVSTKQAPGFYYMDLNGNYLGRLNNPHLEFIRRDRYFYIKRARRPDWSEELGLVVYSQQDKTTFPGFKIAVTNLDGAYYQAYTSGEFFDDYPTWGPDGKTILFQRSRVDYSGKIRIMLLDLESGNVSTFVEPRDIKGATELFDLNY